MHLEYTGIDVIPGPQGLPPLALHHRVRGKHVHLHAGEDQTSSCKFPKDIVDKSRSRHKLLLWLVAPAVLV